MKNIKRIACLVITLMMVASTCSVFAAFSDVPTTESYEPAVSALSQLGIIKGYEDGTFKPDNDVTRAEFTAMLMRTMGSDGIGSTSASELPFTDLSDDDTDVNWAYPNINTAYKSGIINGYEDNTFRPNDNVLYEEAVKMIVCALGYGTNISVDVTPWYTNYMSQARSLGILKSAQNLGNEGSPASRACIAQMLYDSLEVDLVENGTITTKTFLADYLGYIKNTGYIAANDLTSLESPDVSLRDNQIQIRAKEPDSSTYEVHTYSVSDASVFKDKLGYEIDYFYPKTTSNDSVRSLFSYEFATNKTLELTPDMIEDEECTNTSLRYYPDPTQNLTSANLASDNIVIYNGKLYGSSASSSTFDTSMIPQVGSITLLDGDGDGKYETVTVWDYDVYYVSSKVSSDYSITDNVSRSTSKTLVIDGDSDGLDLVNKEGTTVQYSSVSKGDVICYAKSNWESNGGDEYAKAVVVTDKASGSVSSTVSGESITIGGTTYNYSKAAPWMSGGNDGDLDEPSVSDSGSFALDINGCVFAYDKSDSSNTSTMTYGYVLSYDEGSNAFASLSDFRLRVLTQSGTVTDYAIRKATSLNGENVESVEDFLDDLSTSASYQKTGDSGKTAVQQVIKYSVSGSYLDSIYTVTSDTNVTGGNKVESDKLYNYADLNYGNVSLYYNNNKLTSSSAGIDISTNGAIVFTVPEQDERGDSDNFKKKTVSSAFSSGRTYTSVEAFDVSESKTAKVLVLYGAANSKAVDDLSPICVISNIGQSYNDDEGATMYNIDGFKNTRGTKATYDEAWVSSSSGSVADSLEAGDIYRVGEDSDGYITFDSDYKLYPASEGYISTGNAKLANWNTCDFCAIYGSIYAADSSESVVIIPKLLSASDDYSDETMYTISSSSIGSSAQVLNYDTGGRSLEITDVSDDRAGVIDSLASLVNGDEPANVLIYMYQGSVKLMVVIEN